MIQCQLKLRPCKHQEAELERWLVHLAAIWNFAIRKIELNAKNRIYFSRYEFMRLLVGHSNKLGIPSHVIRGILDTAFESWRRCFKGVSGKPRLKGSRNRLTSIPFPDPLNTPTGTRIRLLGIGSLRFHRMTIPVGQIKCSRIVKRASGWYLCLFIDTEPAVIPRIGNGIIGIDPGFSSLLTTSTGEVFVHPREAELRESRLAQAQRGGNKKLVARIRERIANARKDRNHKISRYLVSANVEIYFSKDRPSSIAKRFGKSVSSSAHYQLRRMLAYKSPKSGTRYVEVDSRNSTLTCSSCGAHSGPQGLAELAVRSWACACGAVHDRDVNAAMNTLRIGAGLAHVVPKPLKKRGSHRDAD